ncbi:MAG: hypothetical protein D6807_08170 [Alphaproteobacteria bacterium]|nr:MAG: hypothetical protein D6807_08170 [Alphaproteobacteria bacterium]
MRVLGKAAIVLLLLGLSACGGKGKKELHEQGMAGTVVDGETTEAVDLAALLDPDGLVRNRIGARRWERLDPGRRIDLAFESFYRDYPPATRTLHRNRVQERLIGASNRACAELKAQLLSQEGSGILKSIAGVTKATTRIVTGIDASRVLTGVYGIFSGGGAFNDELFASLTTQVIVAGIDARRHEVHERIIAVRKDADIASYTVEAAVKDALYYHDQCNIFAGMMAARDRLLGSPPQG